MSINFHDDHHKESYTSRTASTEWRIEVDKFLEGKNIFHAADIGCGGGIYSKALSDMGISVVTAIDFSETIINGAKMNCDNYSSINFHLGNAYQTGLPDSTFDLVLERALIHHLNDLEASFSEAFRVLNPDGTFIIQDRTPDDCFLEGSSSHIRGFIFSAFPKLKEVELKRRYSSEKVFKALKIAGFTDIAETKLWETRKKYISKEALLNDLSSRKGRSILYELDDSQLERLVKHVDMQLDQDEIIEQDRWTIWTATKK
ncbi:class I SAM-dependent methyltransferase [Virgibacillus kekensis]|uniref:Class I SAM-dependent methyltransferase n=1 Tax=Virgibacillus kekensis TaxID=202261 RepID=A0ABV9DJI4_9BACI